MKTFTKGYGEIHLSQEEMEDLIEEINSKVGEHCGGSLGILRDYLKDILVDIRKMS